MSELNLLNQNTYENRRVVDISSALTTEQKAALTPGMIVAENTSNEVELSDGDTGAPMFVMTSGARTDTLAAGKITVVDGPFVADMKGNFVGSPARNTAFKIGSTGDKGKLTVEATVDSVSKLKSIVAYCQRSVNADSVARFKVIR